MYQTSLALNRQSSYLQQAPLLNDGEEKAERTNEQLQQASIAPPTPFSQEHPVATRLIETTGQVLSSNGWSRTNH